LTIWILCGHFLFDAVGLQYALKIVARHYIVQYEHLKRDMVGCAFMLFQISWGMFLPEIGKIGWHLSKLWQIQEGWRFFFWGTLYTYVSNVLSNV